MAGPILNVEGLTLRAQGKLVLSDQSFSLPPTGLTALMGPVGTGKSTLLKWLCRRADPKIYSAEVERADYFFAPLGPRNHPLLYGQKQAQSFEQMMMHFSVHLSSNPALICIDEATADLTPKDSERVMERLATMAQSRALLVVSHNQHHMRSFSDHVMLLAGGCVQEFTPTPEFFEAPRSDAGRQFVGSGWVVMAGVDTPSHHLSHDLRTLPFEVAVQAAGANGRLQEIVKGKLYTYALPHDMREPRAEAAALANAGIDTLVCGQGAAGEAGASLARLDVTTRLLPPEGADPGFVTAQGRCRAYEVRLKAGGRITFLNPATDPDTLRALAQQLVFMGVPADKAAEAAAQVQDRPSLDPAVEQELWDFELACGLEADGVDPEAFRVDAPDMPWIDGPAPESHSEHANTPTCPQGCARSVETADVMSPAPLGHGPTAPALSHARK